MKRIPLNPTSDQIINCLNTVGTKLRKGEYLDYDIEVGGRYWALTHPLYGFKKVNSSIDIDTNEIVSDLIKEKVSFETIVKVLIKTNRLRFYDQSIASVIIPAGSIVHYSWRESDSKLRANKMQVHSIYTLRDQKKVKYAVSGRGSLYVGNSPKLVHYPNYFSTKEISTTCAPGLHFFLSLEEAKKY